MGINLSCSLFASVIDASKFIPAEFSAFSREPTIQCRLMKYRPIKCAVIIYGYDADGYKGKGQIFADVKTQPDVLK